MLRQTTPILYGVFTDLIVMQKYVQYLREIYKSGMVSIMPKNGSIFQKQLIEHSNSSTLTELPSEYFKYDAFIGSKNDAGTLELEKFTKRNNLQLHVSLQPPGAVMENLTTASVFEYMQKWPNSYQPQHHTYTIVQERSFTGNALEVDGFLLSHVSVGRNTDGMCVSARIDMGDRVVVTITNIDAFEDWKHFLQSTAHYGKLLGLVFPKLEYIQDGYLCVPTVDCVNHSINHLKYMLFMVDASQKGVIIESEMHAELQLSKDGIRAYSQTTALSGSLGGGHSRLVPEKTCFIDTGLVLDITYKDELVFTAFVPQESFKTRAH